MKKIILGLSLFSGCLFFAQTNEQENLKKNEEALKNSSQERPNGWLKKGVFNLLGNQSSYNNWLAGGQNNIALNLGVNYDFNYKKDRTSWDNKFILAYGLTKIKDAAVQKTDDRLEFNSLWGRKIKPEGFWYYSAFLNFRTQMESGFVAAEVAGQKVQLKNSHFFSPAFLQIGPGMMWKKSDNLKVNIAPATARFIFVNKQFTELGESFGVKQGETSRFEFGAALNGYYKFNLMENISVENILNMYTNYLEDPQNVDLDYQLNLAMKINKYITTSFAFQALYDDNAFNGFQTRQVLGVGFNYTF
jgi:hypothetical protein